MHLAATKIAAKLRAIAAELLDGDADDVVLREDRPGSARRTSRSGGSPARHWNLDALPPGLESPACTRRRSTPPNLAPPDADDRIASSAAHGFIVDVAVVEVDLETGVVDVLDYVTVHDAGRLQTRCSRTARFAAASRTGPAPRCSSASATTRTAACSPARSSTTSASARPTCRRSESGTGGRPSPFTLLGAKGLGEGNTMSVPAALAAAVARRSGSRRSSCA